VTDIARTLTAERGDSADAELLTWAETLDAGVASHARDLDMVLPWARLVFGNTAAYRARSLEQALGSPAVARFFLSFPTLADTPDHCESVIHELTTVRARLATDAAAQSDALTRIDAIIDSLARSAAASGAVVRRLSILVQLTQAMFEAMDFGFLFDPTRKLFSIGYRVSDKASIRVVMIYWLPRRGSQALLPLPRVTSRRSIGFTSVAL
jgi:cyclic beta-1,2-glucan synthetase